MSSLINSFFGGKKRTPEQVVSALRKDLHDLSAATAAGGGVPGTRTELEEKVNADLKKQVEAIKAFVYGEPSDDGSSDSSKGSGSSSASGGAKPPGAAGPADPVAVEAIAKSFMAEEIMLSAIGQLKSIAFETRKDFVVLFNYLVRHDIAGFASAYLPHHSGLLYTLMDGYSSTEIALNCGAMLRECVKLPHLHSILLYGPDGGLSKPLCDLFSYHCNNPNFEVASDAFETLTALLTQNKSLVFECLNPNGDAGSLARYNELFAYYSRLLTSDNYVLKRQSLKLLSELLLDRDNFAIMMRFIVDRSNLKTIMTLLRHNQPQVQFEAFHVFKVFVANPEKPQEISDILALNKQRLIAFLRGFQNEKDDEQFTEEKAMLIETLMRLPDVALPPAAGAAPSGGAAAAPR